MSVVVCDYQREIEEEEDKEAEMSRPATQVCNRQVTKRWQYTLCEKMAAVRNIQGNIEVGYLSMRAA